jgi:hypothetical protein
MNSKPFSKWLQILTLRTSVDAWLTYLRVESLKNLRENAKKGNKIYY